MQKKVNDIIRHMRKQGMSTADVARFTGYSTRSVERLSQDPDSKAPEGMQEMILAAIDQLQDKVDHLLQDKEQTDEQKTEAREQIARAFAPGRKYPGHLDIISED